MEHKMFCYQCQETAGCAGCTQVGVCGKTPDVAAMQDLLVYVTRGLAAVTTQLRTEETEVDAKVNHLITLNLFVTITNANFDKEAIVSRIRETLEVKRELLARVKHSDGLPEAANWTAVESEFAAKVAQAGVLSTENEDIRSLRELITYGLKGLSAYSKHANALLREDGEVDAFLQRALAATLNDSLMADDLVALARAVDLFLVGCIDRQLVGLVWRQRGDLRVRNVRSASGRSQQQQGAERQTQQTFHL